MLLPWRGVVEQGGMRLGLIVVHYWTPELAVSAVAALRQDLARGGLDGECWIIDNGSDERGKAVLASAAAELVDAGGNLGYAGGVNLGAAHSRADVLVLMNADVVVQPGCLAALASALDAGAAVAGPRFYWDHWQRLLLPPAEPRSRSHELLAVLARSGGRWSALARRRSRHHSHRHWEASLPVATYALSGSLLAISRAAWERVGEFDTGYPLYFEETDWLFRLRRAGLASRYVPAAHAVHVYAQSSLRESRAGAWFEQSARRFRRRHYGRRFSRGLEWLAARRRPPADSGPAPQARLAPIALRGLAGEDPLWVEVSPNRGGFPAAAEQLVAPRPESWTLPAAVAAQAGEAPLWVRICDRHGRELACHVLGPLAEEVRP
jgi:N-acetylglucosaminyl-diphospho-decaprenol L-rhamnosyltransferase